MSYFVVCTFDLKNASYADYQNAYSDLLAIGLKKIVVPDGGGQIVIPTTTTAGGFNGTSAASVRDFVCGKVKDAFAARKFSSEIFIVTLAATGLGERQQLRTHGVNYGAKKD